MSAYLYEVFFILDATFSDADAVYLVTAFNGWFACQGVDHACAPRVLGDQHTPRSPPYSEHDPSR